MKASPTLWYRLAAVLIVVTVLFSSGAARAQVYLSVAIEPPVLPVYEQPPIPGPGYIWTPGYWAWGPDGYYWVPGTWVLAPYVGALWTPGYWGWTDGAYWWHPGYWGRHVGFYGGVNYGFGYTGVGYYGGYWDRGAFTYNRAVNNVQITNVRVYNTTVVNTSTSRTSFNGGPRGIVARPTAQDRIAERESHMPLVAAQTRHELASQSNRALHASVNGGNPALAATARPQAFSGGGRAPMRSFSQQAVTRSSASSSARNDAAAPNARAGNSQRLDRRETTLNTEQRQMQRQTRQQDQLQSQTRQQEQLQMRQQRQVQGQMRQQEPMPMREGRAPVQQPQQQMLQQGQTHPQGAMAPQGQMRAPAQGQAPGGPQRQGPPQARGRGEQHKDEQQR